MSVENRMTDYLEGDQAACFVCGIESISNGGFEWIASDCVLVEVTCDNCDASWTDEYWLSAVNYKESRVNR